VYSSEEILKHIKHYEYELNEAYYLLGFLKNYDEEISKEVEVVTNKLIANIKIVCFISACFLDMATSLKGLINIESNWERKYYLKNGYVAIYESMITFNKHQKNIYKLIKNDFPALLKEYKIITNNLKKVKKEHNYEFLISTFRNKAGAHYDEDFETYFEHLKNIDKPESVKTVLDFSNILMSLIVFWSDLIDVFRNETQEKMKIITRKS
tara:strand:+ start:2820 stop:3449 length:630 start_codon:yes stop_codon:yes gene_type:complete